ncbi:dihydrodipicolinate synthase [Xylaria sp. CBS 124048]|nr:dihydrodipicolinate synthase [Xylaria sp. CBS 124048]
MSTPPPPGICVLVPTFFKRAPTTAAHDLYLARAGVKGLVVFGSTGEAVHLTNIEHFHVLVPGTGTQSIEATVEQLVSAHPAGAQWGLCLAPDYFASAVSGQEGVIRWFRAVANLSHIPIPIDVGLDIDYRVVSNNIGISSSTFVTHRSRRNHGLTTNAFAHFTGLGQQLLPVVAVAGSFSKTVGRINTPSVKNQPSDYEILERRRLQYKVSWPGEKDGTRLPLLGGIPGGDGEWARWKEIVDPIQMEENRL